MSYHLSYHWVMAGTTETLDLTPTRTRRRHRRSRSRRRNHVSAWIADTAAHRLRLDAGRHGIAEWERKHGNLTPDELAEGLARARSILRRTPTAKSA